jgi:hypothetical protein
VQRCGPYIKKLLKSLVLVAVSRPLPYGLLAQACAWLGADLDTLVNGAVRAFSPREQAFSRRLRQWPCAPQLAMLARRLRTLWETAGRAGRGR